MMKIPIDTDAVDARFAWFWLQTPLVRDFMVRVEAKGTSPTMKKISQATVMHIPFPHDLSLKRQHEIVERLHQLQTQLDGMGWSRRPSRLTWTHCFLRCSEGRSAIASSASFDRVRMRAANTRPSELVRLVEELRSLSASDP